MMRLVSKLLISTSQMGLKQGMQIQAIKKGLTGQQLTQCRFAQQMSRDRTSSTMQSMREFFMHPLTWDRNNGYLNVVLALVIFSFCFINSCASCPEKGAQTKGPDTDQD